LRHHPAVRTHRFPRFLGALGHRPSLVRGLLTGGLVFGLAAWVVRGIGAAPRGVVAWDVGVLVFFWSLRQSVLGLTEQGLRAWSMRLQASRRVVLGFTLVAATAALLTVFVQMEIAKHEHGVVQMLRLALVIGTVALSWFFVQTMFALDYVHEYFVPDERGKDRGGLAFPGGETPDFWDFLHFSVIIGATAQTADISIVSKPMRQLVTIHSLVAFSFNAVILALTINLTAGLLG
jgi:uncharacterized membrane protein